MILSMVLLAVALFFSSLILTGVAIAIAVTGNTLSILSLRED